MVEGLLGLLEGLLVFGKGCLIALVFNHHTRYRAYSSAVILF